MSEYAAKHKKLIVFLAFFFFFFFIPTLLDGFELSVHAVRQLLCPTCSRAL